MPAAIPLAIIGSTVGGIASSALGSSAANNAANAQVQAANNAAALQHQDAQSALDFNKLQYGNTLALGAPYYNSGVSSLSRLNYLMGLSPQSGLPSGVVNPNAPQVGNPGGMSTGSLLQRNGIPSFGGGSNPLANDPNLGTLPPGNRGAIPQPIQDGTGGANGFSDLVPRTDLPSQQTGGNPGAATNAISGTNFLQNPDAHNFDAGNVATATTNQGGTAQVPRADGGGDPNNPTAPVPGGAFGSLAQGFTDQFQAPTDVTEQNDPGFQFRLQQGQDALQNSAAARGGLLSGGTAKALSDYNQNAASAEYGNVYNRAYNDFTTKYNIFKQNQNDTFNRYATLAGIGQTSAGQLSNAGLSTAGTNANILMTSGGQIGQDLQNAGAARGSGYVGSANAITGGINNATNSLSTLAMLTALRNGSGSAGTGGFGV